MVNANQAMAMSGCRSPIANGYRPAVASGCQSAATGDRSTPTSGQSTTRSRPGEGKEAQACSCSDRAREYGGASAGTNRQSGRSFSLIM